MIDFYKKNTLLYLHVTDLCNLNCKHCYGKSNPNKGMMDYTSFLYYWNKLDENFDIKNINHVILHGGEPLLIGYENISNIIKFLKNKDIKVTIQSNLTLMDNDFINLFVKYDVRVGTSYDYNTNREYNINHLKNIAKKIKLGCVITLTNDFLDADYKQLIIDNLVSVGYYTLNFEFLKLSNINEAELFPSSEKVVKFLKFFYDNFYYYFGRVSPIYLYLNNHHPACNDSSCFDKFIVVNSNGDLFHCNFLAGSNLLSFGNLNDKVDPKKYFDFYRGTNWEGCPIRAAVCNKSKDIYSDVKKNFLEIKDKI